MSTNEYSDWVASIRTSAERFGVLFLQLGSSNEPARRALVASELTVTAVLDYMGERSERPVGTLVIDRVEALAKRNPVVEMGPLRERVLEDVDAGTRIILLSRAPRAAFPETIGSSLLDDASFAHAPILEVMGADNFPACVEDGADPGALLEQALRELGPEVCASLDRAVYEGLLVGEDALGALNARELEALEGAGITSRNGLARTWNFPRHLVQLKQALDEVLADQLEPQLQLARVSEGLWKIERMIRREVRRRAVHAWGECWRTQCLTGDLPGKVIERATESAYLSANSVKQIRDPLEWLTLGELLGLKERSQIGDLGVSNTLWRQFRAQVMPIRNRLAHMRTLQPEDASDVTKWLRVLESTLKPK